MATEVLMIDTTSSQATFTVKKLGLLTVKGTITDFNGQIEFDPKDLGQSSFDINLKVATINTGTNIRDEHLRSADFFSVETIPHIHFKSTSIKKSGNKYQATGQLTIVETSKEVKIPFEFENGIFKGTLLLNRLDYSLGKKFPTFFIGNNIDIAITCKVQ